MSERADEKEMPTNEELRERLAEIEADERLHYPIASGFSNWPLLAIQHELHGRAETLRWVLGLPSRCDFGQDETSAGDAPHGQRG